jgi:hypothetical protein
MNAVGSSPELPYWRFPRSLDELSQVAEQALEPRERFEEASLDGGRASWIKDAIAVTQFAGSGILYQNAGKKAAANNEVTPPLAGAPLVKLQDPLIIVPGWGTFPSKFDHLKDQLLASGQNGERAVYLKDGQAFADKACSQATEVAPSDRVFIAVFDSPLDAPDSSAPQLREALALVKKGVSERVDLLGYSMGGLATRKMLDDGTTRVDQVALLGTANRGTRFATLAEYIIHRDINWAMSLGGINAAHLPAMGWLKTWDPERPESNPNLDALNQNLDRQLAGASEFLSVAATGYSTLTRKWGGGSGGDGLVPASSTTLEGIPSAFLPGRGNKHHGNLPHDKDVFNRLTDYFGWSRLEGATGEAPAASSSASPA